jgi:hypothetical protein
MAELAPTIPVIIPCRTCHGEGWVFRGGVDYPWEDLIPCVHCDGTGSEIMDDDCWPKAGAFLPDVEPAND